MKKVTLISLLSVCVLCISCTKPVYTSFETSNAKITETLAGFSVREVPEEEHIAEQRLIEKSLVDYKKEFYKNDRKLKIHQYELSEDAGFITIKNNIGDVLFSTSRINEEFNISYDKKYLGICDNAKVRIFDMANNLYELTQFKDIQCQRLYFSLDNTYLIVNNKKQGQIYDFKTGKLVYHNKKHPIEVGFYLPNEHLIMGYVIVGDDELILLDEGKRVIVKGLNRSYKYSESIIAVMKDKDGLAVLIKTVEKSFMPFVSFAPFYFIKALREF